MDAKFLAIPLIVSMVAGVSAAHVRATDTTLVGFGTRNDFSETTSTATRGVFGARDWIVAQFEIIAATSGGRMTVRTDDYLQPKTARTPRDVTESSVVAELVGDEPGRTYIMSSHYDDCHGDCTDGTGIAPGADDNASGVAAVLEAARVMAPHHFKGTILFVCFDGEELGLWGSAHLADELKAKNEPVLAMLNNDVIGNSTGGSGIHEANSIRVFSEGLPAGVEPKASNLYGSENDSPSRELARFVGDTVPAYVPKFTLRQIYRADRNLRGGDQESFQADGFAAIRFVEPHENFIHQHQNVRTENGIAYGDLPQYVDFDYIAQATRANVAALATLALAPAAPTKANLLLKGLGYDAKLRWTASSGATAYEIVWRATDASMWQHAKNVGNVTEATLPVSNDDYIFGVRALDAGGLRSPATYALPARER
ncbi:MAG: M28 family metallopeptidase [Candidatus Eremiobacteraeota bacterium]|nr:M28 family metallopeptidase [Candidatus Eremiobacteraeota bacterium]